MGQIKKSSELRKDQKALISVSAENLTAMTIDSYLEGRLGTRLYLQTIWEFLSCLVTREGTSIQSLFY